MKRDNSHIIYWLIAAAFAALVAFNLLRGIK